MRDPYARYQAMQVQTAGRGQLLLLLLDGAIERLRLAAEALDKGDPQGAMQPAWRAQAIVLELLKTLDMERGGQLASTLRELYTWWIQQILSAILNKDAAPLREVGAQIQEQRGAWAQASGQLTASPVPTT